MTSVFIYNLIKSLHIISVIAWMTGMFYLPRLFVYHAQTKIGSESSELFKVMEGRLLRYIMTPAMLSSWIFGILLFYINGFQSLLETWALVKVAAVFGMSGAHGFFSVCVKQFNFDLRNRTENFYRYINELPTILLIIIVFSIVFKY